jgi:hypothetical protein
MKNLAYILAIVIFPIISFGQRTLDNSLTILKSDIQLRKSLNNENGIQGSPYKSKEFVSAIFYQKQKPAVESTTRLNYYQNYFEFMIDDQLLYVDPSSLDSVKMEDHLYLFKTFEYNNKNKERVVQFIGKSEKSKLYKYESVIIKPEVKANGFNEPKPESFEWTDLVYVTEIRGNYFAISSLSKLINAFPENETDLKKFIKTQKIKKDNPASLLQLLQFIDTLN